MQIVIDIPEEKFYTIKNKMYCGIYDSDLYKAIANGTPLLTITNTEEAEAYPISENIKKGFEEFTKLMFKQGQEVDKEIMNEKETC